MLSTSLERSALGKIRKPAPFPLCCIKAPDLSMILISLPFFLPPPSPSLLFIEAEWTFFLFFFFSKILSKISDQRQWWHKLKSRLPQYFTRSHLLFRAISLCKICSCVYCHTRTFTRRSQLKQFTELGPQSPSVAYQPPQQSWLWTLPAADGLLGRRWT